MVLFTVYRGCPARYPTSCPSNDCHYVQLFAFSLFVYWPLGFRWPSKTMSDLVQYEKVNLVNVVVVHHFAYTVPKVTKKSAILHKM